MNKANDSQTSGSSQTSKFPASKLPTSAGFPDQDRKSDAGKPRMGLLPFDSLEAVADILTFGAEKYGPRTWQTIEAPEDRYLDALLRHLSAHAQGEDLDPESQRLHLAHAACNALFLLHFALKGDAI